MIIAHSGIMRAGLASFLSASPMLSVVGTFPSLLPTDLAALNPDVILLEWDSQDEAGLPWSNWLSLEQEVQLPAIVLLTDEMQSLWITEALRSNVRGILPQDASSTDLILTLEAAANGLTTLHADAIATLLSTLPTGQRPTPEDPTLQSLTPREIEVLGMLAEGLGNKAIARHLTISEHTVKFHVGSILSKLNASSRTEAVMLGARQGLIML